MSCHDMELAEGGSRSVIGPVCDRPTEFFGFDEKTRRRVRWSAILSIALCLGPALTTPPVTGETASDAAAGEIISKENLVDSLSPSAAWQPATVGQKLAWHDRLRTGEDSRAAVRLGDLSILRLDELTEAEVLPPPTASAKPTLDLKQGTAYFFSREKSREINVQTPVANGGIRGTEFIVTVAADGATSFIIIDGEVEAFNDNGSVIVRSGERADIETGGQPTKSAVSSPIDSAMWCSYYPGVLDPKELMVAMGDSDVLRASLSAYREGDLLAALQQYPPDRIPDSTEEKVYRAALFLVAGQVGKAEGLLQELDPGIRDRQALSTLIASITLQGGKGAESSPRTAGEWLAQSYYLQSIGHLVGALQAAERATTLDPDFGFGWTRVGELELGQGQITDAKEALEKGLRLAPRNPAAHALRGFILSQEGKLDQAKSSFEKAMALDSALGDAWDGRGLCLIRQDQVKAGRRDLFVAAALEPNRADFRKYLADELNNAAQSSKTRKERSPRSGTTDSSRQSHSGPVQLPDSNATPEPVYPGRILGPGININPNPTYPNRYPGPRSTKGSRPDGPQTSPHPEKANEGHPRPSKDNQHPPPSKHPSPGQPTRRPTPPPAVGQTVDHVTPANPEQTRHRKKAPTASQSPTPN
jgi:tetratricopeptide (TPR) repeat protein